MKVNPSQILLWIDLKYSKIGSLRGQRSNEAKDKRGPVGFDSENFNNLADSTTGLFLAQKSNVLPLGG